VQHKTIADIILYFDAWNIASDEIILTCLLSKAKRMKEPDLSHPYIDTLGEQVTSWHSSLDLTIQLGLKSRYYLLSQLFIA
jgi:hypothetical protein